MVLDCDLVLLEPLLSGRVDLHPFLHKIMVLDCDLILLEPRWVIHMFLSLQIQQDRVLLDQGLVLLESQLKGKLPYTLCSTRSWFFTVNSYYQYWISAGLEIEIEGLSDLRFITTKCFLT